jgi:hypothetical protein
MAVEFFSGFQTYQGPEAFLGANEEHEAQTTVSSLAGIRNTQAWVLQT